jgi:hypothetical protein
VAWVGAGRRRPYSGGRIEEDGGAHLRVAGVIAGVGSGNRLDARTTRRGSGGSRRVHALTLPCWGMPELQLDGDLAAADEVKVEDVCERSPASN